MKAMVDQRGLFCETYPIKSLKSSAVDLACPRLCEFDACINKSSQSIFSELSSLIAGLAKKTHFF